MTGVFTVFMTLSAIEYKMLGLGMALAILMDATVVRGVLLPAAMSLLGERAWSRTTGSIARAPSAEPSRVAGAWRRPRVRQAQPVQRRSSALNG